ncbi:unnamed protein product [Lymnaea stagnalis]|uniref:G-protein coupled receptors family 1 profile domain-containing protein n=1 Tax=Lymnaea stagnalis TaxID=6523 RepID=A0AAV2H661_LYMST
MLVLFRHGVDDSKNIVLFGLSVADMIYSFSETYGRIMYIALRVDLFIGYEISLFYIVCFVYFSTFGMVTSVWLVSLISFERMIAVCFPFHVSRLMSPMRMRCMVVLVFTFIAVLYSPSLCMYYLDLAFRTGFNITILKYFTRREYIDNEWWISIMLDHILPAFECPVPMISIIIFTFATILKLIKANKSMGSSSTSKAKRVNEMRSIKISLIICGCMAFSILVPNACIEAYPTISGDKIPSNAFVFIRSFNLLAVQFSATMNFFIYVALSSKFKSTCFDLFKCNK